MSKDYDIGSKISFHSCFHGAVHVTSEKEDGLVNSWLQINQVFVVAFLFKPRIDNTYFFIRLSQT